MTVATPRPKAPIGTAPDPDSLKRAPSGQGRA